MLEYAQLEDKNIFDPQVTIKLSYIQRKNTLRVTPIIKKKRRGKIKVRVVENRNKQRLHINNEAVMSPTIHLKRLIMSMAVDGYERRDMTTTNVVSMFLIF